MTRERSETARGLTFADDGWSFSILGDDPAREPWAATLLAVSNGAIGVRGAIEERAQATTFLAHAYEQSPIRYHERLHGFAASTDSRVPVAETLGVRFRIDGGPIDLVGATPETSRTLDIRRGIMRRETRWTLADGRTLIVQAERLVPLDGRMLLVRRLRATLDDAAVDIEPHLAPAPHAMTQSDDPRVGVDLASTGFATGSASESRIVERLPGSGIGVAASQRSRTGDGWTLIATGMAAGREESEALAGAAQTLADDALAQGFEGAAAAQEATLAAFWETADVAITGDARLAAAIRANLFHLFASAGRDGRSSAAAKGLTGEGYEGHYFWDTEAFMLPVLAVLAPEVARAMLLYRVRTLDAAVANARALDHERGALYAWRTIEGRECSAHYPSGSAQYHINAAIAYGLQCYVDATGDEAFLREQAAPMLIETARLWLSLGDWTDGGFHLRGVTGPDEYTALIDDNWYTNRMAQRHLRFAADVAERCGLVEAGEVDAFRRAAEAMHLPYDAARGIDAQDASFLDKPRWDVAGTPADRFPLLLHYHPMTLYRHQVAKQADLVLGMVLAGADVSVDRKRRVFDYYEPVTTHDSTLSASSFAILAAEIGHEAQALRFLDDAAFVDLEDRHGNTGHGVHMASLAGSWMALVWGFAGFRFAGPTLAFRPMRPAAWGGYRFGLVWRGTALRVDVLGDSVTYRAMAGPAIALRHHDRAVALSAGESWTGSIGE